MAATCQAPGTLQTRLPLAALPTAPACARGHVRTVAHEWGLHHLADTAELLTSELVTNAVQASQNFGIRADLAAVPVVLLQVTSDKASIVIHVWDGSDAMPTRRSAMPDEEGGRGLMLVETLSKDWGAYRKDGGKVVWAQITGEP
jgi:anti-sigma regulatory factor (Ser/Thr protein kinase)